MATDSRGGQKKYGVRRRNCQAKRWRIISRQESGRLGPRAPRSLDASLPGRFGPKERSSLEGAVDRCLAAQEIYPRLGRGPIPRSALARVQELRDADVRTLHRLQRGAGRLLLGSGSRNSLLRWLVPRMLPLIVRSGLFPRLQRRLFFGVPLPPLDPAFGFRA